jgi:hypothetical protein
VILRKCSMCSESQSDTLTWCTWAWNRADGERVAYKQKLCVQCIATTVAPLYVACESPIMTCPNCGIDTTEDMDPVYATFIPKGLGMMRIEAPMCASCAAQLRLKAQNGAEKLENRDFESRGQETAPRPSAAQTWEALGLVPRGR